MKLLRAIGAAGIAACGLGLAGAASAGCQMQVTSEYHLIMLGNEPLVDAEINGRPVHLLLDTGASNTNVTEAAVVALGLKRVIMTGAETYDTKGAESTNAAVLGEFKLGPMTARNITLIIAPQDIDSADFQGLLGNDLLGQSDMELDFADNVVRLFKVSGCTGDQVVYWGKAYSTAPIVPSNTKQDLNVYASLDGERVMAALDTGTFASFVTTKTANEVSSGKAPLASDPSDSEVKVFPTFSLGDETIHNTKLRVADLYDNARMEMTGSLLPEKLAIYPNMILGADFIRAHRIYVARSQGLIYFSYNGGPVFQVNTAPKAAAPVAAAVPARPQ